MSNNRPVSAALDLARGLLGGQAMSRPPIPELLELVRRFSGIDFAVPNVPDSDGYLFQYGKAGWLADPTFVLSVARQLEVVDSVGDHDYFVQVQFEYRYLLDDDLKAAGSHSEWWFPGGEANLADWLEIIGRTSIVGVVSSKTPYAFELYQDQV